MKLYIAALMLAFCIGGYAQKKQASFVPPFDFPLTLSGNFGEIRSNHFHGGLDFKTGGVVGKPVRGLADGYISRICVTNGSGFGGSEEGRVGKEGRSRWAPVYLKKKKRRKYATVHHITPETVYSVH